MKSILGAAILWTSVGLSRLQCVLEKEYFCSSIPNDFPEGLTSILFVVTNLGVLNSTIFKSPNLASVTSLALANSGISKINPGAFHAFRSLTKLSLYQNALIEVSASWLSEPGRLENLTLAQNLLVKIEPESFSGFSSLTTLNIASNQIREIASGSFRVLSKLTSIDLSGNHLTSLTRNVFGEMKKLPGMSLSRNPWSCSCEQQDSVQFLQELVNLSLLQDAASVTCHSPVGRKGIHIWNISDFNCTPSFLPSAFGNNFYSIGLPAMLASLAFISSVLLVFCIWVVTFGNKRVQPSKETVEPPMANSENYDDSAKPKSSAKATESTDLAKALKNRMPKVRPKSASAILMQKAFCREQRKSTEEERRYPPTPFWSVYRKEQVGQKDLYHFKELWDYQKLEESKRLQWQSTFDLHTFLIDIHRRTTAPKDSSEAADQIVPENKNSSAQEEARLDHPEPLLYLSVTSAADDQVGDKPQDVTSKRESYSRLKRSLSWPFEKKVWDQGSHRFSIRESFAAQFLLPSLCQSKGLEDEKSKCDQEWLHLSPKRKHLLGFGGQHEASFTKNMDFSNTDVAEPIGTEKMEQDGETQCNLQRYQDKDTQIYTDQANLELEGERDNHPEILRQKKINLAVDAESRQTTQMGTKIAIQYPGVKPRQVSKPVSSQFRTHHETPPANAAFTSSTDEDDGVSRTKKESGYIDLLHEVVENRGRWTRERWKQTHQSCAFHQPPAKSK